MKSVETLSSNPEIFHCTQSYYSTLPKLRKHVSFYKISQGVENYFWRIRSVGSSAVPINLIAVVCYLICYEIAIQT